MTSLRALGCFSSTCPWVDDSSTANPRPRRGHGKAVLKPPPARVSVAARRTIRHQEAHALSTRRARTPKEQPRRLRRPSPSDSAGYRRSGARPRRGHHAQREDQATGRPAIDLQRRGQRHPSGGAPMRRRSCPASRAGPSGRQGQARDHTLRDQDGPRPRKTRKTSAEAPKVAQ